MAEHPQPPSPRSSLSDPSLPDSSTQDPSVPASFSPASSSPGSSHRGLSGGGRVTRLAPLIERPRSGHKGLFGRILVVGGNPDMLGAPVLAGTAAYRCGAGWVQIAVDRAILAAALSITPELVGLGLDEQDDARLLEAADRADVIVLGPGLGQGEAAVRRTMRLITLSKPMVIDADALNILAARGAWPGEAKASAILTPHPGEMKRLLPLLGRTGPVPADDAGRIELARASAAALGQVVLLKGDRTVIADDRRFCVNRTGDSSLSKAGSGDVLCGVIGALLASGLGRFEAACAAAWIHGRAGELAGARLGRRSVLARDVIDQLGVALDAYEDQFGVTGAADDRDQP